MLKYHPVKAQLFTLASLLFLVSSISAAEQSSPKAEHQRPSQDRFAMMAQKAQLTDKQKADLKPMLEKLQKNRIDTLKKLDEQEEKELASILKPEQVTQVNRFLKRNQRMGGFQESMKTNNDSMEKRKASSSTQKGVLYPRPPAKLPEKQ